MALGSQILKVAMDFDRRVEGGIPPRAAVAQMRQLAHEYDETIVGALEDVEVRSTARPHRAVSGRGSGTARKEAPAMSSAAPMTARRER